MKVQCHVDKIEKLVLFMFVELNFPDGFKGKSKNFGMVMSVYVQFYYGESF